jgi:hypothetical protein
MIPLQTEDFCDQTVNFVYRYQDLHHFPWARLMKCVARA